MTMSTEDRLKSVQHSLWGMANDLIVLARADGKPAEAFPLALRYLSKEIESALKEIEAMKEKK